MTATIAPADEACLALVDRINSGTDYVLEVDAEYSRVQVDQLELVDGLKVDLVADMETQLEETLGGNDPTSHDILIVIRKKIEDETTDVRDAALLSRQIFERVNNWDSANRRVQVWECDVEEKENPNKRALKELGLFSTAIKLRVEVQP